MKNDPDRDLSVEYLFQTYEEHRGFEIDPDFSSDVRVPVLPRKPTLPDSAIALSEPEDENLEEPNWWNNLPDASRRR